MSKIFRIAIAIVVATVMIEPLIIGTITLKKSWRSVAPSSRAASMISVDTPLMAADRTTIAKPVWSQIMITISAKMLIGLRRQPRDRLPAEADDDRVEQADLRLAAGCQAYTKFQMTDAPMSEMASGRKMNVLASASRRTRSNRPAMTQAQEHAAAGGDDQPDELLRRMSTKSGVVSICVVAEGEGTLDHRRSCGATVFTAG